MDILTRQLRVEYSEAGQALLIINPAHERQGLLPNHISLDMLGAMSFDEASAFVGSRILLRIPEMRELFQQNFFQGPEQSPPAWAQE